MTTKTPRLSSAMLDMLERENQGDGLAILSRVETRALIAEVRASRANSDTTATALGCQCSTLTQFPCGCCGASHGEPCRHPTVPKEDGR